MLSQHGCYDFGKSKHGNSSLKIGIGKNLIPVKDVDNKTGTVFLIEGEIDEFSLGLITQVRTGDTYFNQWGDSPKTSVDSRYSFLKRYNKFQVGGYAQINSTAMWADGIVLGSNIRYGIEMDRVGFMADFVIPVWSYHRRAVSPFFNVDQTSWLDLGIDPIHRTRSTEYRLNIIAYFKIINK